MNTKNIEQNIEQTTINSKHITNNMIPDAESWI